MKDTCVILHHYLLSNGIEEKDRRTIFTITKKSYIYETTYKVSFILLTVLSTSFVSLTDMYGNLIHQTSPVLHEYTDRIVCQNETISNDECMTKKDTEINRLLHRA
jgi:hypothetical protein